MSAPFFSPAYAIAAPSAQTPFPALAADIPAGASVSQATTLADVNIRDASVVVGGAELRMQFTISNDGAAAQPDVKYGLELFKVQPNAPAELVDTYVVNDTLSLSPQQSLQKSLAYSPPAFFSGTYQVWAVAKNSSGMPFSVVPVGEVTLIPSVTGNYVAIDPTQCDLVVTGSTTDMRVYSIDQGVDILSSERLTVLCLATSHFSSPLSVQSNFKTFTRSQFGNAAAADNPRQSVNTLAPNTPQPVRFLIPRPQEPQAYDALLTLTGVAGATVSNTILIHYVLRGNSGTIENASLDKDSYSAGDVAKVAVVFTGSADSFLGARYAASATSTKLLLTASIDGQGGSHCASPASEQVDSSNQIQVLLPVNITAKCVNPVLGVDLADGNGTVLDHKTYSIQTGGSASSGGGWLVPALIALGVAVLLFAAYVLVRRIRKSQRAHRKRTNMI